jgi:hypothetical protein
MVINERSLSPDEMAQLLEDLRDGVSDDPTMAQCRSASDSMKLAAEIINLAVVVSGRPLPTAAVAAPHEGPQEDSGHVYTETARNLMRFYGVRSLDELVEEQAKHVKRLQDKLPPYRDPFPGKVRGG